MLIWYLDCGDGVFMCLFILWLDGVLNDAVTAVRQTPCPCSPQECPENDAGYKIGIALVREMEVDEAHSVDDLSGLELQSVDESSYHILHYFVDVLYLCSNCYHILMLGYLVDIVLCSQLNLFLSPVVVVSFSAQWPMPYRKNIK